MQDERFARIELLIGAEALSRLTASFVTVVGLGAVGSYAVEGLARAGIGRLRLVDFDVVRQSNINRQLYALDSTVGTPKVDVARQRIADINPACAVETLRLFAHVETMGAILAGPPDLVVDAIDSVRPKIELITAVLDRGIRLVSCMGAALRTDPLCVRVGPLSETIRCPLARQIRRRLRRRGVSTDFPSVYSIEPVAPGAVEKQGDPAKPAHTLVRGRTRTILGSLPTLTGIVGLTAANEAIHILAGLPGSRS